MNVRKKRKRKRGKLTCTSRRRKCWPRAQLVSIDTRIKVGDIRMFGTGVIHFDEVEDHSTGPSRYVDFGETLCAASPFLRVKPRTHGIFHCPSANLAPFAAHAEAWGRKRPLMLMATKQVLVCKPNLFARGAANLSILCASKIALILTTPSEVKQLPISPEAKLCILNGWGWRRESP